jgi:hypothetical protein
MARRLFYHDYRHYQIIAMDPQPKSIPGHTMTAACNRSTTPTPATSPRLGVVFNGSPDTDEEE